jgi:hypothetical protein
MSANDGSLGRGRSEESKGRRKPEADSCFISALHEVFIWSGGIRPAFCAAMS